MNSPHTTLTKDNRADEGNAQFLHHLCYQVGDDAVQPIVAFSAGSTGSTVLMYRLHSEGAVQHAWGALAEVHAYPGGRCETGPRETCTSRSKAHRLHASTASPHKQGALHDNGGHVGGGAKGGEHGPHEQHRSNVGDVVGGQVVANLPVQGKDDQPAGEWVGGLGGWGGWTADTTSKRR